MKESVEEMSRREQGEGCGVGSFGKIRFVAWADECTFDEGKGVV